MLADGAAALLITLAVLTAPTTGDLTTTSGASGAGVVDAVVNRIDASCVFPDDKLLGRRIAYVESLDGTDSKTFRNGYYGGIWQMDEDMFLQTKAAGISITAQRNKIKTEFGIDWTTVTWQDLTTPLHSALAARLFIHNCGAAIPRDVDAQAAFFAKCYRLNFNETVFKAKVKELEDMTECKNSNGADIMFVVDGSNSIGVTNFQLIKNFLTSVVVMFDIGFGEKQTRIGLIQFGTAVVHEFNLTTYSRSFDMIAAIDRMPYRGGGTNTHLALDAMRVEGFSAERGARPLVNGHPRIGIVVTDGESTVPTETAKAAQRAHDADINMISVGVAGANMEELKTIAGDPVCLNVFMLDGFLEFDSLKYAIEKRSCEAPMVISLEQGIESSLDPGKDQNCKIKVPTSQATMLRMNATEDKGLTVRVRTTSGSAKFYLSNATYPSAYFNDALVESRPGQPGVVYIEKGNKDGVVYANILGHATQQTDFKLEASSGDSENCKLVRCPGGDSCVETGIYACKSSALQTSALLSLLLFAVSSMLLRRA